MAANTPTQMDSCVNLVDFRDPTGAHGPFRGHSPPPPHKGLCACVASTPAWSASLPVETDSEER